VKRIEAESAFSASKEKVLAVGEGNGPFRLGRRRWWVMLWDGRLDKKTPRRGLSASPAGSKYQFIISVTSGKKSRRFHKFSVEGWCWCWLRTLNRSKKSAPPDTRVRPKMSARAEMLLYSSSGNLISGNGAGDELEVRGARNGCGHTHSGMQIGIRRHTLYVTT
jgi:hypothetical protein